MLSYCADKPSKSLMRAYHTTFSSAEGQRVLRHILLHCGMFDVTPTDPVHLVLLSIGKQILKNCGIWRETTIPVMLGALFGTPVPPELEEKDNA